MLILGLSDDEIIEAVNTGQVVGVSGELLDSGWRRAVLDYLKSFPTVLRGRHLGEDVVSGRLVVPMGRRTNGDWIWELSLEYYLERYSCSPGQQFLSYLLEQGFQRRLVTKEQLDDAFNVLAHPGS